MKLNEEIGQDRDDPFLTDDEEKQVLVASSSVEDLGAYENYGASSPLSRNQSDEDLSGWPQSYRQSMDMLTGVSSPNVSFIPRTSSQISRRHISGLDSFSSTASNPLLSQSVHEKEEVHTSALEAVKAFVASQLKLSGVDLPLPEDNRCSFAQSVLNGINVLCGIGLLTMPYAIKEGGWIGVFILLFFGIVTCYTGILLKRCLESSPGLRTYPDIGQAAFGTTGRVILSILLYAELYASCVEYIIMMSDNLSGLFPDISLTIFGVFFNSTQIFATATTAIVLPTVWLRDLRLLSYLSVGGVFSSILLALCLFWVGAVDGVGFHPGGEAVEFSNLPVAVGILGFGFAGHSVFPNVYSSMKEPSKFPLVLFISFSVCTFLYISVAVCGYMMFGDAIQSQFTLNMPKQFLSSKIAVWTAVMTPMAKYALTLTPVVLSLEELLPSNKMKSESVSILLRTVLVISTLVVALAVPYFATVAALMGSFIAVLIALIFPCLCYLSILKGKLSKKQIGLCIFIIIFGSVTGCCGTYSAIARLIGEMT